MYDMFIQGQVILVVPEFQGEGDAVQVTVDLNGISFGPPAKSVKVSLTWEEVFKKLL